MSAAKILMEGAGVTPATPIEKRDALRYRGIKERAIPYLIKMGLVSDAMSTRLNGLPTRTSNIVAECKGLHSREEWKAALETGELRWDGNCALLRGKMIRGCGPKSFTEICRWAGFDPKPLLVQDAAIRNSVRVLRAQLRTKQNRDGTASTDHLSKEIGLLQEDLAAFMRGERLV